ncbi:hypothetical protein N1031_08625 [Herbiconiux moechotypicola]|uniref:DUF4352 domain-containing protein n=1 Tax=Herbiconiux moechotypicola TaxID=637393 RepID=A0ABP5QDL8_9MICO|nr:hypothetical protein [Herbiconiux moechotypicola]MCS5729823.1 hypothetical protein [Herbiconiux moechotypicola]
MSSQSSPDPSPATVPRAIVVVIAVLASVLALGGQTAVAGATIGATAGVRAVVEAMRAASATEAVSAGESSPQAPGDGSGVGSGEDDATEVVRARFGQTVTYDDGLQLSIGAPEVFEPSPESRGGGQAESVIFTITLHNPGSQEVPLRASSAVSSAGEPASVVVDGANGLNGVPPVGSIAPGQTVSYREGYSVASAADVVVLLEPSSDYYPARFATD